MFDNSNDDSNDVSKWKTHTIKLRTDRSLCEVAAINDHQLVITGGSDDITSEYEICGASVELFDIKSGNGNTQEIASMGRRRRRHVSIVHAGYLYVIGGENRSHGVLRSVEKININNINTASWETVAPMKGRRFEFAAASHRNYIYVFGGYHDEINNYIDSSSSESERLNVSTNRWESIPQMKQSRSGHAAVTVGDKVYIMGGKNSRTDLRSMEIFDTKSQKWEEGEDMPMALYSMRALVVGNQIIIMGRSRNIDNGVINKDAFLFDTKKNKWTTINGGSSFKNTDHFAAAILERKIVVVGDHDTRIEYIRFNELLSGLTTPKGKAVAIMDSPNQFADRLGYMAFITPLVQMAQQVEGLHKSLCISINAPWGSGKSFTIKLIKGKLQKQFNDLETKTIKELQKEDKNGKKDLFSQPREIGVIVWKVKCYIFKEIISGIDQPWKFGIGCVLIVLLDVLIYLVISVVGFVGAVVGVILWPLWEPINRISGSYVTQRKKLNNLPYADNITRNLISEILMLLIYSAILIVVLVAGMCYSIIWWICSVSVFILNLLLGEPLYSSFSDLCHMSNKIAIKWGNDDRNRSNNTKDEIIPTTALIIVTSPIWVVPLLVVLLPLSFVDFIIKKCIVSNIKNCKKPKDVNEQRKENGIEMDLIKKILSVLRGERKYFLKSDTGVSKSIVEGYHFILSIPKLLISPCYGKNNHVEYPEEGDVPKYIIVDFGAWVYNGSDKLWTSILREIWDEIGKVYGPSRLRHYRASVELERSQRSRNQNAATDSKSKYQARQEILQSFQIKSFLSVICATGTTIITTYLKYQKEKLDLSLFYVIVGLGLLPLTRQIYIFLKYILPKPWVLQIHDKATSKREKLLNDTGYAGMVKEEFDYILDFLRYTPFYIDEKNKAGKCRPHLCIFVDDLDRCDGDTVMKVLEATILMLVDAPVTCWLAIDTRLVVATIEDAKKGILEKACVTGYDFMEKIVQIPFCIPELDDDQKLSYMSRLFLEGQLDPVHLLSVVKEIKAKRIDDKIAQQIDHFDDVDDKSDKIEKRKASLRALAKGMDYVTKDGSDFISDLVPEPKSLIKRIVTAIKGELEIDDKDEEDFLYLVCEWIDWSQDISRNFKSTKRKESSTQRSSKENKSKEMHDRKESELEKVKDNIGPTEVTPLLHVEKAFNGDDDSPDEENQISQTENYADAPLESMVNSEERKWFKQYIQYMGSTPRRMIRISNIYNISRCLVEITSPKNPDICFNRKLLKITVLCEQWPHRMSLLIKSAEVMLRKSLNKIKKLKDPSPISFEFENLELRFVRKSKHRNQYRILCDKIEEEKNNLSVKAQKVTSRMRETKDVMACKKIIDNLHEDELLITELESLSVEINYAFEYREEGNELSKYAGTLQKVSDIVELLESKEREDSKSNILKQVEETRDELVAMNKELLTIVRVKFEEQLKEYFSQLSLYDIYDQLEEKLIQFSRDEKNKSHLRDGDCHKFHELLIEDSQEDECCLKMIDLVLPNQIKNYHRKSYRPFMINISRHMLEQSSQMMEMAKTGSNECQDG